MRRMIGHAQGKQRGDTLIEVLIAITVLAVIVTGAMAIMNRSLVSIMNSSERTAVRAEINSQTEMLNWARTMDQDGIWRSIKSVAFDGDNASEVALASKSCRINQLDAQNHGSFYLTLADNDASGVKFYTNMTKTDEVDDGSGSTMPTGRNPNSRATTPVGNDNGLSSTTSSGIWIDAVYYDAVDVTVPYFDFYIKACWVPRGSLPDSQTLTIVRIYDRK